VAVQLASRVLPPDFWWPTDLATPWDRLRAVIFLPGLELRWSDGHNAIIHNPCLSLRGAYAMSVNTKAVEGRRKLRFETLDDLEADVQRLADVEVKTLGNWSLAQLFNHLASGLNSTIDGSTFKAPFLFKLMAPFMKKKFIYGSIPAGFQISREAEAQFQPKDDVEFATALGELQQAIARVKEADSFAPHPMFGKISKEENVQFQLRHAEMHLSFAIPAE
jgi:hypothetical protein